MRQAQPKEVKIKGHKCYIYKFGAMDATMIFGDLVKTLSPLIGLVSIFAEKGIDTEISPELIANVFKGIDGETLKKYIKTLLIDYENVFIEYDGEAEKVTENNLNKVFTGQIDGIFELMFEVLKENYSSFFDKSESRIGRALAKLTGMTTTSEITANLT